MFLATTDAKVEVIEISEEQQSEEQSQLDKEDDNEDDDRLIEEEMEFSDSDDEQQDEDRTTTAARSKRLTKSNANKRNEKGNLIHISMKYTRCMTSQICLNESGKIT